MADPESAELYALLHRGTPGDLTYYQAACRDAESLLELGCGYGRVLERLTAPDRLVVGVDLDPDLLRLAARHQSEGTNLHHLIRADMRTFALGRRFDRILIPFSGIYCLLSREDCLRCLESVAKHLAPGGLLLVDAYGADALHPEQSEVFEDEEASETVVSVEWNGRVYDVFEESLWRADRQRIDVEYVYRPRDGSPARSLTIRHRYWLRDEFEPLLAEAGLQLESLAGDFDGTPWDVEAEHWVLTASASRGR